MANKNFSFKGMSMNPVSTLAEGIEKYGMGFKALKLPLYFKDENDNDVMSPDHMQMVNGLTGRPMGVVGCGYVVVDYPIAFSPAEPLLASGARIVGGACPNKGERAYLILESDGVVSLSPGDNIVNRFIMLSSHDGTGKIEVRMTPWRAKTGTALTFDAGHPLAFKHTRRVNTRVQRARKVFKNVNTSWDEFSKGVQKMVTVKLTESQAKEFIENVLPTTAKETSTRLENIRSEILTIYRDTGIGTRLPKCRGTLFGLVQAFNEWADIKRTVRKSKKRDEVSARLDAMLVSDSAKKKSKAWAMALYLANHKGMSGALTGKR